MPTMKKLAYGLAVTCIVFGHGANAGLLNCRNVDCTAPGRPFNFLHDKAIITRTDEGENAVFRFSAVTLPEDASLQAALARYRNIPGFHSLQFGADNEVVLTTDKAIAPDHLQRLLLSATRLYGHIGFELKS